MAALRSAGVRCRYRADALLFRAADGGAGNGTAGHAHGRPGGHGGCRNACAGTGGGKGAGIYSGTCAGRYGLSAGGHAGGAGADPAVFVSRQPLFFGRERLQRVARSAGGLSTNDLQNHCEYCRTNGDRHKTLGNRPASWIWL